MSVHLLATDEFAGHLRHCQQYGERTRHHNIYLQQEIEQLKNKMNQIVAYQKVQEEVIEAQRKCIRLLESAHTEPSPLELTPTVYISTDNTQLAISSNTTPSYAPAIETPKEDYIDDSLLALVDSYGSTEEAVTRSLKRKAEDELDV